MSDLTGTVSPTPVVVAAANAAASTQAPQLDVASKAAAASASAAHGVTFAHRQDSFYSAYSPAVGVFSSSSDVPPPPNNTTTTTTTNEESGSLLSNNNNTTNKAATCKATMLDQVLGVVDGACHRTMDLTLGGMGGNGSGSHGSGATTPSPQPQWGMAPSEDDDDDEDESTCLDTATMGDTLQYTTTSADYLSTVRGDARNQQEGTTVTPSGTTVASRRMDAVSNASAVAKKTTTATAMRMPPGPTTLERESSELHENFELVLGQNALAGKYDDDDVLGETAPTKKRGWGSRLSFANHTSSTAVKQDGIMSRTTTPTITTTTTTTNSNTTKVHQHHDHDNQEEEKKDDHAGGDHHPRAGPSTKMHLPGQSPSSSPSPAAVERTSLSSPTTPTSAADERRESLYQSVFGNDFGGEHEEPPRSLDVGVEIQSRRVLQQDWAEQQQQQQQRTKHNKASSSSSSPKKALSTLVKKLKFPKVNKGRRGNATSLSLSTPPKPRAPMTKKLRL